MIEQTLRRFCEFKHRWLIVIAGTFVVGFVLVMPLVDLFSADRDEKTTLLTELDSAKRVAGELKQFEKRVAEKLAELQVYEARTVDDASLPTLRGKLVDFAKETQCSIRRLSVGNASSRPWTPGEDPISPVEGPKKADSKSMFVLEWRPVSISLTGTSTGLRTMLDRIAESKMLMHAKSIEMYPSSPTRQSLTLDMELWYFTLARRG
ncbi:MAG TPA: hypothetical protein VHK01_10240 [Lacipirellulaceae bacterium]|jgi:hypothetical protein|nr:hypothetical protein [Lacipirellulaceae bacterium]